VEWIINIFDREFDCLCYNFSMTRKNITVKRIEASRLRPQNLKPFSVKKFIEVATNLEAAIRKEEEKYGSTSRIFA